MAYSKEKLKENVASTSLPDYSKWEMNQANVYLCKIYCSFHLNTLYKLLGWTKLMRMLYIAFLSTKLLAPLKSTNSQCSATVYSHFSQVSDEPKTSDQSFFCYMKINSFM
jgi:hypothetical protein